MNRNPSGRQEAGPRCWPRLCGCAALLVATTLAAQPRVDAQPAQRLQAGPTTPEPLQPAGPVAPPSLGPAGPVTTEPLLPAGSTQAPPLWAPPADNVDLKARLAKLRAQASRQGRKGSATERAAAQASWLLGLLYLHGKGVSTDRAQAQRWFERARSLGEPLASAGLAWCQIDGCTGAPDASAARLWIGQLRAVDVGLSLYLEWFLAARLAPVQVAPPTAPGQVAAEPSVQHRALLVNAARAGSAAALTELGLENTAAGRLPQALEQFRSAATHSPAAAANAQLLAVRMQAAEAQPPRSHTPQEWFEDARRYHRGDGVPANYAEAIRLYQVAASAGSKPAQRMLQMIYSRPASTGTVDIAWMQQLANIDVSQEGAVLTILPAPSPRLFVRDPTPLYALLPPQWRASAEGAPR